MPAAGYDEVARRTARTDMFRTILAQILPLLGGVRAFGPMLANNGPISSHILRTWARLGRLGRKSPSFQTWSKLVQLLPASPSFRSSLEHVRLAASGAIAWATTEFAECSRGNFRDMSDVRVTVQERPARLSPDAHVESRKGDCNRVLLNVG